MSTTQETSSQRLDREFAAAELDYLQTKDAVTLQESIRKAFLNAWYPLYDDDDRPDCCPLSDRKDGFYYQHPTICEILCDICIDNGFHLDSTYQEADERTEEIVDEVDEVDEVE